MKKEGDEKKETLWDIFKIIQIHSLGTKTDKPSSPKTASPELPPPIPLLIFDQFEELFINYTDSEIQDFAVELSELLYEQNPKRYHQFIKTAPQDIRKEYTNLCIILHL